ncbi:hypothetical protein BH23CHL2_BH23CHL2_32340 [soil metagenome]
MPMSSLRVLIVEDSGRDADLLRRTIETAGYTVISRRVDSAEEMAAALAVDDWDVILSDFGMPRLDGFDVLQVLREHSEDIPLIVVSGTVGEETAVDLMKAGATDYIMKGNLARLVPAIARELRDAEHRRARQAAEARLIERERMLSTAQRIANLGSWERDYKANTLWWSEELYAVLGYPLDYRPSTAGSYGDVAHPEDQERVLEALDAARERGESSTIEHRIVRADGTVRWVYCRLEPEFDGNDDRPARLSGTIFDITERRETEETLRFQARLLDTVEQAVIATDLDGRITYWNSHATDLYGWRPDEVEGRNIVDVTPAVGAESDAEQIMEALRAGRSWTGEFRVRARDGHVFWAEVTDAPIFDEQGQLVGIIGVSADISDRKQAEAALRASEESYRALMEQAADGIIVGSPDGTLSLGNSRAREMFGYTDDEFREIRLLDLYDPEELVSNPPRVADVQRGLTLLNERGLRRKDGTCFQAETSTKMLDDGRVQFILRDITERKRAEEALKESETKYRTLLEQAADGIVVADEDRRIITVNSRAGEMFGFEEPDDALGLNLSDFFVEEDISRNPPRLTDVQSGATVVNERLLRRKDGSCFPAETSTKRMEDGRVQVIIRDITERRVAEDALRRSEQEFRNLFERANDTIVIASRDDFTILDVNQRALDQYGYSREELIGRRKAILSPGQSFEEMRQDVLHATAAGGGIEVVRYRKDGTAFNAMLSATEVDFQGRPAIMSIARDITVQKRLEQQLAHQALHDPLTGLANRVLFHDRMEHALARARGNQEDVAILMLDLDRFKVINESLGHDLGDRLLVAAAGRILECVRENDTVARFGGDEFVALVEGVINVHEVTMVAERIGNALQRPFDLDGHEVVVTASIGIYIASQGQGTPEDLLRNADVAMYRAKDAGRQSYLFFESSMNATMLERLKLEADLRQAIFRKELRVHFQPVVNLATNRVVGHEALVRWMHPTRGLISPASFIPMAEEAGLIREIDHWVLSTACRQLVSWHQRYPQQHVNVNVNLSAQGFQHPEMVQDVQRAIADSGVNPSDVQLEITESVIMTDAAATHARLRQLKDLGVRIAIDDFGTGYSSLSYLKRFPVDTLKIDKTFIDGLGTDPEDTAIVQAIISLAVALGLTVTAEGLETRETLGRLVELACEQAQGYYFARPMPAESLESLWANGLHIDSCWRESLAS